MFLLSGCTSSSVADQAKLFGDPPFTKDAWAGADQERRGQMVASFLARHAPASLSVDVVKQLPGPPTGYCDYDENCVCLVGPRTNLSRYGKGYLLAFISDRASGKLASVKILPEPRAK